MVTILVDSSRWATMCQARTEKHLYPWSENNEHSRIQMVVHDSWMLVWRSASVEPVERRDAAPLRR